MNKKAILYFYIISLFMLVNDALFTWLGHLTGIVFWRQLIWIINVVFLFDALSKQGLLRPELKRICHSFNKLYIYLIFSCVYALAVAQFNPVRIVHAFIGYTYGLPFLLFPFMSKKYGWSDSMLNRSIIFIGAFMGVGFIVDYLLGGTITVMFYGSFTSISDEFSDGRYNFLSTAPTITTMLGCLALVCCFREVVSAKRVVTKWMLLLITVIIVFGSFFSGSRQSLAAMLMVEVAGIYTTLKSSKLSIISIAGAVLVLALTFPDAQSLFEQNEGAQARYNSTAIKEDTRYLQWKEGFHDTFNSIERMTIGEGIGYVHGMKAGSGEKVGRHYESTVYTRISEIGLIGGLIWVLLPVIYLFKYRRYSKLFLLYAAMAIAFLFICYISPNGGSELSQISIFILLGLCIEDKQLNENYEYR